MSAVGNSMIFIMHIAINNFVQIHVPSLKVVGGGHWRSALVLFDRESHPSCHYTLLPHTTGPSQSPLV